MRAAVIERYGEAPVLREGPDPEPAEGLILVEVRAAGLNPGDLRIASGGFYAGSPPPPSGPGGGGGGRGQGELGHAKELTEAFRKASGGGVDVVIDPVWGEPAAAAVEALNRFGRLVQIGQSAGAEATLTSSSIRGRSLAILGYTTYAVPQEQKAAAYRRLVQEAAAGRIAVESEAVPLEKIQDAWSRQPQSPHRKLVLVP